MAVRICSWCSRLMDASASGPDHVTHGMCESCLAVYDPQKSTVPELVQHALVDLVRHRPLLTDLVAERKYASVADLASRLRQCAAEVERWALDAEVSPGLSLLVEGART